MKAVNLLPTDLRSGPKGSAPAVSAGTEDAGGPGPFIALGALFLAVVAVTGYVLTANTVQQRKADLADATRRAEAVTRQVDALKPYADFATLAQDRISTIRDLAGGRFDWNRALSDLSRALPNGVTLSQLQATVSSDAGTAGGSGAASGLRSALNVPAIELQGCTRGQTDVARLMSRLRNVDRVTRVSLSKSDKETSTARPPLPQSASGSASTTQTGANVNACGIGSHPTFDIVAFFEHDAAAAAGPAIVAEQPAGGSGSGSSAKAGAAAGAASASSTPPAGGKSTTASQGQSK